MTSWFRSQVSGLVLRLDDVVSLEPKGDGSSCVLAVLRFGGSYVLYPEEIVEFLEQLTGQQLESYNEGAIHLFPR